MTLVNAGTPQNVDDAKLQLCSKHCGDSHDAITPKNWKYPNRVSSTSSYYTHSEGYQADIKR